MSPVTLVIVVLVLLVVAGSPGWGYHRYGWGPSGIIGVVLVICLILVLFGRL